MAEISQYTFKHSEVITALIKSQDLHEGIWTLSVSFGFAVANVGPTDRELNPAAMNAVQSIGLQRVPPDSKLTNLMVDAAKVNPPG
jgi:hypothetical protein